MLNWCIFVGVCKKILNDSSVCLICCVFLAPLPPKKEEPAMLLALEKGSHKARSEVSPRPNLKFPCVILYLSISTFLA